MQIFAKLKMQKVIRILFSGFTGLILLSCSPSEDSFTVPVYKDWRKPVNRILDTPVPGHGSTYRIIYANDTAFNSKIVEDDTGRKRVSMNDGSVIVKEVYKKRTDINNAEPELTIMVKDIGSVDSLDGWTYYMVEPGKKPLLVRGRMCIGCHEAANEQHPYFDKNRDAMFRDYLFVPIASER